MDTNTHMSRKNHTRAIFVTSLTVMPVLCGVITRMLIRKNTADGLCYLKPQMEIRVQLQLPPPPLCSLQGWTKIPRIRLQKSFMLTHPLRPSCPAYLMVLFVAYSIQLWVVLPRDGVLHATLWKLCDRKALHLLRLLQSMSITVIANYCFWRNCLYLMKFLLISQPYCHRGLGAFTKSRSEWLLLRLFPMLLPLLI